jgi:hypothetical protein
MQYKLNKLNLLPNYYCLYEYDSFIYHYLFFKADVDKLYTAALLYRAYILLGTDWIYCKICKEFDHNPSSLFHFGKGNVWYADLSTFSIVQF